MHGDGGGGRWRPGPCQIQFVLTLQIECDTMSEMGIRLGKVYSTRWTGCEWARMVDDVGKES